jgi:ribosomal protein L11
VTERRLRFVRKENLMLPIEKHPVDLSLDQVIEIAKEIRGNSKAKELKGTVKEVLGAW